VGAHAVDGGALLLLAGRETGMRLPAPDVVPAMVAVAKRFVEVRGKAWRIAELSDIGVVLPGAETGSAFEPVLRPPVGWIEQDDGRIALGAAVPLGSLSARVAEFLAAIEAPLVITPWRSVLVCDLNKSVADVALRVLAPMGLVFDDASPWLSVSACTGSPGCEHSAADVRADAVAVVESADTAAQHRHFVGCERACGTPPGSAVLVATADGYVARPTEPLR
jgi:precorrin-3B synthase